MLRLIKLIKPATNTNSINATIRTRCFSAKARTAFMAGSVGPDSAIDKDRTARHDLLAGQQAGANLDHAVADPPGADLAQRQGVVLPRNPDASAVPFVDDRPLRNCQCRRRLT